MLSGVVDINQKDSHGYTPLHLFIERFSQIRNTEKNKGHHPTKDKMGSDESKIKDKKLTQSETDLLETLEMLLLYGADINEPTWQHYR